VSRILAVAAIAVLIFLSFSGISTFGVTGPDEPRYASIGQEMARSNDWVTPRLWGAPWFEKPALLYWTIGAAFKAGFSEDVAPRLPVACLSVAFLLFFFNFLRMEFNLFVGSVASALLATSAMWMGFSHVAVTDIPLAVFYCAAVLFALPAVEGRPAHLGWAAASLALSVLAKGLVPLVLFLPFFWYARKYWRNWLKPVPVLVFLAVALPWYIACTVRNGPAFLDVFFLQHQLGRFTSPALQHVQPFWFYLPWMIGALFPSILLLAFAGTRRIYVDDRRRLLLALIVFGFVFFSASRNKLPGYILPLLPFVCILTACGMDAARRLFPKPLAMATALSMFLLPVFMLAAGLLPRALAGGGAHALFPVDLTTAGRVADVIPIAIVAAIASFFLTRERALVLWFALVCAGWGYVEYAALPWLDRMGSARMTWRALPEPKRQYCVGNVSRGWRYGLNYYAVTPLRECAAGAEAHSIEPAVSGDGLRTIPGTIQ
jgi:4-amino-4-deoxy-L-arabinose transferase-like glycosyltransferase